MTEQHRQQAAPQQPQPTGTSAAGQDADGAGEEELGRRWAEFSTARASLAEVMSDDELRGLGIDLEILDQRP